MTSEIDENLIRVLEQNAEYEKAFAELQEMFLFLDEHSLDEVEDEKTASLLILCGSITSALAFQKQTPCQKQAIEILSRAWSIFSRTNNWEKLAEAENTLGVCYWRQGLYSDAEYWLNSSLQLPIDSLSPVRLKTYHHLTSVLLSTNRDDDVLSVLKKLEKNLQHCNDEHLLARFHNQCGLALRNSSRQEEAISHFQLSRRYLKRTGNRKFQGIVENNLAHIYLSKGDSASARQHALSSLAIYRALNDVGREASTLDTLAQIQLKEGNFSSALENINRSIEILAKGNNYGLLLESYLTKCRILFSLDALSEALGVFAVAHELAALKIGEEKAQEVRKIFEDYLSKPHQKTDYETSLSPAIKKSAPSQPKIKDTCEFELPDGLKKSGKHVVWRVNVDDFVHLKLPKGTLLLIERCASVPDNSFAVLKKDEEYHIGFVSYLRLTGHYALDLRDGEMPEPFLKAETTVFGRIVAYCPAEETFLQPLQMRVVETIEMNRNFYKQGKP